MFAKRKSIWAAVQGTAVGEKRGTAAAITGHAEIYRYELSGIGEQSSHILTWLKLVALSLTVWSLYHEVRYWNSYWQREVVMRQPYRCVMVLAGLLALGFTMNQFGFAAEGDAAKGKLVYEAKCVTCHGPEGKGDGPIGKQLNPPAGDFTGAQSKKKSEAELLDVIQNGKAKTAMMAWKKQLNETEVLDVLAYVLTLRK